MEGRSALEALRADNNEWPSWFMTWTHGFDYVGMCERCQNVAVLPDMQAVINERSKGNASSDPERTV